MTSITVDKAHERVRIIQESANFTEAAARLGIPIITLKTWARRNPKYVSTALYEEKLQLTPGELTARRHSLKKAVAAAVVSRKRPRAGTRPGPVKTHRPEPVPVEVASPQEFTDAFFDRMMVLREQAHLQAERIATLEGENRLLKAEIARIEKYRTEMERAKEADEEAFRRRIAETTSPED